MLGEGHLGLKQSPLLAQAEGGWGQFDRQDVDGAGVLRPPVHPALGVRVRRDRLLEDGYAQLRSVGQAMKGRLVVSFVNSSGLEEAGLDYGGLIKEFLEEVGPLNFESCGLV